MENPVDHTLDLGLVNFIKHPDNPNYIVYRFADPARAASFEEELTKRSIWFEKGEEMKRTRKFTLYGIHKNDFKVVQQINFDVEGKHKGKFIPFKFLRYSLLIFSFVVVLLAILGYCKAQERLNSFNDSNSTVNGMTE